jgi:hypothetical protein
MIIEDSFMWMEVTEYGALRLGAGHWVLSWSWGRRTCRFWLLVSAFRLNDVVTLVSIHFFSESRL